MTYTEFYGNEYELLKQTQHSLTVKIERMMDAFRSEEDIQPIVYYCSRIKSPDSMIDKLQRYGLPVTREAALGSIYDAVGVRVICSFTGDVISVIEMF